MASNTQGAANGFGTFGGSAGSRTPITFTVYDAAGTTLGSGFVMPTVDGFNLTHGFSTNETHKGNGDIDSLTLYGEYIECQFDLVFTPSGATITEAAQAAGERSFPIGSTVSISGAPVRAFGPFTDSINVTSGGIEANRWIYYGGTSVRRSSTGHSTGSVTLRRYPGIAATGAAIVV